MSALKSRPTVVLAEDSSLMSERLQQLLAADCELLAAVTNGDELVKTVRLHRPDVVVTDLDMPVMSGLEAARLILEEQRQARIVFVTAVLEPAIIRAALSIGAFGFVSKRDVGRELIPAIRSSIDGQIYVSSGGWNAFGQAVRRPTSWFDDQQ